jgi:hypothetical protein
MKRKITSVLVGLACALALAAGSAQADVDHANKKIVVAVDEIGFLEPTAACELGTITFALVPRASRPHGSGASCIHRIDGCSFAAGCRATVFADFTFSFPQGSVTAPMLLKEVWPTATFVRQRARGRISSGTGAFAGARGSIKCRGTIDFSVGADPDVVCTVRTKGHDDDDD